MRRRSELPGGILAIRDKKKVWHVEIQLGHKRLLKFKEEDKDLNRAVVRLWRKIDIWICRTEKRIELKVRALKEFLGSLSAYYWDEVEAGRVQGGEWFFSGFSTDPKWKCSKCHTEVKRNEKTLCKCYRAKPNRKSKNKGQSCQTGVSVN